MSQEQKNSACKFGQVYNDELLYIWKRRGGKKVDSKEIKENLIGLALSGGGIRSATTCLGMLQGLSKMGVLPMVDYLSTISGGGYIGSCLSALLSVNENSAKEAEDLQEASGMLDQFYFDQHDAPRFTTEWENFPFRAEGNVGQYERLTGEAQVKHLRIHGNFVMARQGLFARETMRSIGNLLTGVFYHLLIVLLALFSLSALYVTAFSALTPGLAQVLRKTPAQTEDAKTTRIETTTLPPGETRSVLERRTQIKAPTLWTQFKQKKQRVHTAASEFFRDFKTRHWPFSLAFVIGIAIAIVISVWMWRAAVHYQNMKGTQRYPLKGVEKGDSQEDDFERKLLFRVGVATLILTLGSVAAVRLAFCRSLEAPQSVLWLFLPVVICVGERLASIVISAFLPRGELSKKKELKLLWTRGFRSLWGAFQAMTTYGIVSFLVLALLPILIYALVEQQTFGLWTGLGGTSLSLLASRLLATRFIEVPGESKKKKRLPFGLVKLILGVAVGLFMLFVILGFCTLIVSWFSNSWCYNLGLAGLLSLCSAVVFGILGYIVNYNKSAPHYFYRDRLLETYLRTEVDNGEGQMALLFDAMEMPLTHLHGSMAQPGSRDERIWGCTAPYHLIGTAINLPGSRDLTRKDRKSGYFLFSKLYCGSAQTNYRPTEQYYQGETKLARALTISGAAASSAIGHLTFFAQAFALTLFNMRLGYWMANPERETSLERQEKRIFWPKYLFREMFAKIGSRGRLVNLSDGGHTGDNIGICPLLERRCKVIIACDAECDTDMTFGSFTQALRHAYIDWGIDVDIDLTMLRPDPQTGRSRSHCAVGRIFYPDRPKQRSWLIYLKNSLTGDELEPVENYAADHPAFPHESTADLFFDDNQFESYRALGVHIAEYTFGPWVSSQDGAFEKLQAKHSPFVQAAADGDENEEWLRLQLLHSSFKASDSPEFQQTVNAFVELERLFMADEDLGDYYAECYLQRAPRVSYGATAGKVRRKIAHACMLQTQLMEQVFFTLRLDRYANAPDNSGWINLFRCWGNAPTFQQQFVQLRTLFSHDFVEFYERYIKFCPPIEVNPVPHPWDDPKRKGKGMFLDPGRREAEPAR